MIGFGEWEGDMVVPDGDTGDSYDLGFEQALTIVIGRLRRAGYVGAAQQVQWWRDDNDI